MNNFTDVNQLPYILHGLLNYNIRANGWSLYYDFDNSMWLACERYWDESRTSYTDRKRYELGDGSIPSLPKEVLRHIADEIESDLPKDIL